ncbi:hypothetical protein ACT29H_02435 [Thermophagus sp. OGC60D27]|uniref:hypothetical protein n=1 Tax=Thermophagus sp. OGC60D27 TaxID=3458415 RepID=UPI0040376DA6
MAIKIVTDTARVDKGRWERFVGDHPDGNIYQMPYMYELYCYTKRQKPITFFAFEQDELVGLLIVVQLRNVFPPFTFFTRRQIIFGGPLIKDNDSGILLALVESLFAKTARSVVYTEIRNYRLKLPLKPVYEEAGFYYEPYLTVVVDIDQKEGKLWASLSPERRKNIENLKNDSFEIRELVDKKELKTAWKVLRSSFLSKGRPMPNFSLMQAIINSENLKPKLKAKGLFLNGSMKATVWLLLFDDRAHIWMEGNLLEESEQWIYDGFLWDIIRELQREGVGSLEMGSGGRPGKDFLLRQYKKSYGGMIRETGRFVYVHNWFLWNLGRLFYRWYKKVRIFYFHKYYLKSNAA